MQAPFIAIAKVCADVIHLVPLNPLRQTFEDQSNYLKTMALLDEIKAQEAYRQNHCSPRKVRLN
jgi:hypothetical protein